MLFVTEKVTEEKLLKSTNQLVKIEKHFFSKNLSISSSSKVKKAGYLAEPKLDRLLPPPSLGVIGLFIHQSLYQLIHSYICLVYQLINQPFNLSIDYHSIHQSIHLSINYQSVNLSIYQSIN